MTTKRWMLHSRRLLVVLTVGLGLVAMLVPALADPLPDVETYPRVAFVARNDVPFDSLAVGPVAGALGGVVLITSPTALSTSAREGLVAFAPELVVIAGGEAAISSAVEAEIVAAGGWQVRRAAGSGRDQTASEVADLLGVLGAGRPALVGGSGQVAGDLPIGGQVQADSLTVEQDTLVTNLNADLLDGLHAEELGMASATVYDSSPVPDGVFDGFTVLTARSVTLTVPEGPGGAVVATAHGTVVGNGTTTEGHLFACWVTTDPNSLDSGRGALMSLAAGELSAAGVHGLPFSASNAALAQPGDALTFYLRCRDTTGNDEGFRVSRTQLHATFAPGPANVQTEDDD